MECPEPPHPLHPPTPPVRQAVSGFHDWAVRVKFSGQNQNPGKNLALL